MATKLLTPLGGGVTLEAANTATDKTLTLPADNGTVVYANSSGNVGIGTASPSGKLDVAGSVGNVQVTSAGNRVTYTRNGANYIGASGASASMNYVANTHSFYNGAESVEAVRIDSSGIVTGAAGNLMLVRGTSVASTSGTAIGFTGIPSWAKRVTLVLQRVTTSSTAQWIVQIGSGSYATSGYESASQTTYSGSGATISQTTGMAIFHNAAATYVSGTMTFTNISGNIWVQDHTTSYSVAGSNQGGGYISLGGVLDRIQITTVGGANTFTGGSINIFYE